MSCSKKESKTLTTGFHGKSAYGIFNPTNTDTKRVVNHQSTSTLQTPSKTLSKEGFNHATKKMFHKRTTVFDSGSKNRQDMSPSNPNNTYFTNHQKNNISDINRTWVAKDGFCDNITSEMYIHKKKRVKEYEKKIGLRDYVNNHPKRVLKENDTKKQYDRQSQIACLGGNHIREEPKKHVKNMFNSNSTADIYMNQHVWNRNIFTNNQDKHLKVQKENLMPKDRRTGSLSKLQATTPELENMGIWKPTRFSDPRKKSDGKFNRGMLHQNSADIKKTYFGAPVYQTHKNWDYSGKKKTEEWRNKSQGGKSMEMKQIPAKRESNSTQKKLDFLTGSISNFN